MTSPRITKALTPLSIATSQAGRHGWRRPASCLGRRRPTGDHGRRHASVDPGPGRRSTVFTATSPSPTVSVMHASRPALRERVRALRQLRHLTRWYATEGQWQLLLDADLAEAVLTDAVQLREVLTEHQIRPGSHAAANYLAGLRRGYLTAKAERGSPPPDAAHNVKLLAVALVAAEGSR